MGKSFCTNQFVVPHAAEPHEGNIEAGRPMEAVMDKDVVDSSVEEESKFTISETNFNDDTIDRISSMLSKASKVAIFSHSYVDPDAIGSMMAVEWLIKKLNDSVEVACYYDGPISHPQNVAMVNLLDPNMHPVSAYNGESDLNILVDTIPVNAGVSTNEIKFNLVIDHHKEAPPSSFCGTFLNVKAGSCCGTIYKIIKQLGLSFSDISENDIRVATAMLVGISTDTENLMSDDATVCEFVAWMELFDFRNATALKKIVNYGRPKFWIEHAAAAVNDASLEEGICVAGLGIIPAKHRDMIADMADNMVSWEDVNTAIAFAIIDGNRIEGCVRSRNDAVMVPQLCKDLATKHGNGGGKYGKGAYRYALGGMEFDEEEEESIRSEVWKVIRQKETKRIMRIMRS